MRRRKLRTAGLVSSVVAIWILSVHFIINIFVLSLTFVSDIPSNIYKIINGSVLAYIVLFQLILLIYNSVFICVVGRILRQEEHDNE